MNEFVKILDEIAPDVIDQLLEELKIFETETEDENGEKECQKKQD